MEKKAADLQALRARLRSLAPVGRRPPLPLGLAGLDAALGGGLARGCLHEVMGAPGDGAALGFCVAMLSRLATVGPVLWCQPRRDLYAPGLAALGLDPAGLIVVTAPRPADRLWAVEEGLRCPALAAALVELDSLDLTAARRLQLAAETSGVTGLVLRPEGGRTATNVTVTRWRVTSAPAAAWQVKVVRCRGGRPGQWLIDWSEGEWRDAAGDLVVAAALGDRAAAPV